MKIGIFILLFASLSHANENFVLVESIIPSQKQENGSWETSTKIEELVSQREAKHRKEVKNPLSKRVIKEFTKKENNTLAYLTSHHLETPQMTESRLKEYTLPIDVFLVKKEVLQKDEQGVAVSGVKYFLANELFPGWKKATSNEFDKIVTMTLIPPKRLKNGSVILPRWKLEITK